MFPGTFGTAAGEIEEREDSLVDDTIDEEGFAKSRLVVGSVESDAGGFVRQESQGSLSGRSVDLDVPVAISEDVFQEEHNPCFEMEPDNSGSVVSYTEECTDTRTTSATTLTTTATVSRANSEVNTPESIVVLTSESNSPDDGESPVCASSGTVAEMKQVVFCGPLKPSPISSPDSIEVLGSSSLLTSPSSIEVSCCSVAQGEHRHSEGPRGPQVHGHPLGSTIPFVKLPYCIKDNQELILLTSTVN